MGVKSLWKLLEPVGRPILLETFEGKTMAIDSSIWMYQFQATMRDKEGRPLMNAHVLGFLRRIAKLLFHGIKPIFVFDGGAPALKRSTLNDRRKKKSGAAASHVKLAERLLAAHMRREALNHTEVAQASPRSRGKAPETPAVKGGYSVYLEDLDPAMPQTPARKKLPEPSSSSSKKPGSSSKKPKFHDHDPYQLPDMDLDETVAKVTRQTIPDPRLATEEELRAFIEDMRPEDFDVNSAAFRELPTEVQYEIVGDLRLKSRQTSYSRLQKMLEIAHTPLDFSKQQIKNLKQRNELTQQLLTTTDSIGSSHLVIPVRIASERNREYVLMKNEGEAGGWILGIRDDGTRQKPIEIDHENDQNKPLDTDSDDDMEEVVISAPAAPDPDLLEYQRSQALSAVAKRYTPKKLAPLTTRAIDRKTKRDPFAGLDAGDLVPSLTYSDEEDEMVSLALQQSLDDAKSRQVQSSSLLMVDSTQEVGGGIFGKPGMLLSSPKASSSLFLHDSDDDLEYITPRGMAPPTPSIPAQTHEEGPTSLAPSPLASPQAARIISPSKLTSEHNEHGPQAHIGIELGLAQSVDSDSDLEEVLPRIKLADIPSPEPVPSLATSVPKSRIKSPTIQVIVSDEDMEEVLPQIMPSDIPPSELTPSLAVAVPNSPVQPRLQLSESDEDMEDVLPQFHPPNTLPPEYLKRNTPPLLNVESEPRSPPHVPEVPRPTNLAYAPVNGEDEPFSDWSRSASPEAATIGKNVSLAEGWDAAEEMDPHAEEGEFARFISQVKNKNIQDVRREIDDEIKSLNHQKKAAIRDSEDITQQMVSQIMTMLRLFGIPYITAPMEAEAQCAELVTLNLADGVITDDSDVFLFGAQRVFKNMFNQSKTVECFLLSDLSRELGLDRDTLIRLAYLLGSDYVDGLPGVGPVMAMELLKEFPGEGGLHKFKDWWIKVQSGKDRPEDNQSKFRKQFKKKFKDLYLPDEWPNSAVRDAYYHPTVDGSEEPFKWGLPDLDALRVFFREELGWAQNKVDELLLPVIQKMGKRTQAASLNKQGNLNDFFEISSGSGTLAPRKRQAYASKRLQQVVADFRKKQNLEPSDSEGESPAKEKAPTKKRKNNRGAASVSAQNSGDGSVSEPTERATKKRSIARPRPKPRAKNPRARTNRSSPKPGLKSSVPGSACGSSDEFVGGAEEHAGPSVRLRVALRGRKPAE